MTYPQTTTVYAAVLALLFAALGAWVIAGRFGFGVLHGNGNHDRMDRRIRSHANFAEFVPMILFLAALLEAGGTSRTVLHALLAPLLVARVIHPFGMVAAPGSPAQYLCRGGGAVVTLAVLVAAAGLLLVRVGAGV